MSNKNNVEVLIVTSHHAYRGWLPSRGYRVGDILNDPTTDLIHLHEAHIVSGLGTVPRLPCKQLLLRKGLILFVILLGDHESPLKRWNNFAESHRFGALVALPGFILTGFLTLPLRINPASILDPDGSIATFIPMTDVRVHSGELGEVPESCETALIRRHSIESVQLASEPKSRPAESQMAVPV